MSSEAFYRVALVDGQVRHYRTIEVRYWTIVYGTGADETEIGTAWADEELAQDICDLMNMAYDAGQESKQARRKKKARL